MSSGVSVLVPQVLSGDEYSLLPEAIRNKIDAYINTQLEDNTALKTLLDISKVNFEQKVTTIENELAKSQQECLSFKTKLEATSQELELSQNAISQLQNELSKLKEVVNRLEGERNDFRHQRDLAVDERNQLLSAVERRTTDVERLHEEIRLLSDQLQAAHNAKCEALVKVEEVESLERTLDFKEKRMDQERERLNKELHDLTGELNKNINELMNLRRNNTTKQITLETQLAQSTEELRISQQTIAEMSEANANLQKKMEISLQKMMAQREKEEKMHESYFDELESNRKLADQYKGIMEQTEVKCEFLEKSLTEQQKLHTAVSNDLKGLQLKMTTMQEEFEEALEQREKYIQTLQDELSNANDLIKAAKHEKLETAIEDLSPTAANISRLIKSGMTLTQLYTQYANVSEQLMAEKEQNQKLNDYMNTIIREIEAKAPIMAKQRQDYEALLENVHMLTECNDKAMEDNYNLKQETLQAKRLKEKHERDNDKLKKIVSDISKQVCFLMKEIESLRGNYCDPEVYEEYANLMSPGDEALPKHLITFSNIEELQEKNRELLSKLTDMIRKSKENDGEDIEELKAIIKEKEAWIEEHKDVKQQTQSMMDAMLRQVETYRALYFKSRIGQTEAMEEENVAEDLPESQPNASSSKSIATSPDNKDNRTKELELKLQDAEKAFKELKEESDTYRIERQTNERMLIEQVESMRAELRDLRTRSSKLISQAEFSEERFKILDANATTYRTQIAALESKCKNYNTTIIKHEQTITHLKDETISSQRRLTRAEVGLDNARKECRLLRESESRLQKDCEVYKRERQGQSQLMANLDTIRTSLERGEAEGKARLENRLDETMRECHALRRRLQEEQDRFREYSANLERQTETAKQRFEEEKQLGLRVKEEVISLKEQLAGSKNEIEEFSKRLKELSSPPTQSYPSENEMLSKQIKELELKLTRAESDLKSARDQLSAEKQHSKQFSEIAESIERRLDEVTKEYNVYKEKTERKLKEGELEEKDLQVRISQLEHELSTLTTGTNQSSEQLNVQLTKEREALKVALTELDQVKHDLSVSRLDFASLSGLVRAAEEKYAHEVVLHSTDLQSLTEVKKELEKLSSEVSQLRLAKEQAEQALEVGRAGWEERERLITAELKETQGRIEALDAQNAVLHDQIEALSSQLAIAHAQAPHSSGDTSIDAASNRSFNTSFNEEDSKSSEQLMQIIKYMRREKDIAVGKFDVLRTENLRLKSQLDSMKSQFDESKRALAEEREKSDVAVITSSKLSDLLRKVETLDAITDSNRILRAERDSLQEQVKELSSRVENLESELGPQREQNRELTARVESVDAENVALRGEANRLRQRVNFLIERSNKTSPEDWRRLQQEREGLTRQLTAEKEAHQRLQDETRCLRLDRTRYEEQVMTLSRQYQQHLEDIRRQNSELNMVQQHVSQLNQELNEKHAQYAKIAEDVKAKDAMLIESKNKEVQIRKIAKKYKSQFEELSKTVEDEKKNLEEQKALAESTVVPAEISAENQEQLRDEGRRQVEFRIQEVESRHTTQLKELSEQVTSTQEAVETLRKENDSLKNSAADKDERAKTLLKQARQKIFVLSKENKVLTQQIHDIQIRVDSGEQTRLDEGSVRLSALTSQYEGRIARLERENLEQQAEKQREIEALTQRVSQLQRQVDKIQISKPSTSSGPVEKGTTDPPTANIKPMAGPSSSGSKQQPTQQTQSVAPWPGGRGETPLASIRPMSMQSRTVAVLLPTSQLSQSSHQTPSQGTPVLVPPQQQLVHTTGSISNVEMLISSPTSSHTDYMPATSSAGGPIRQVLVQPTITTVSPSSREEPPISAAESTQDMEAESCDVNEQQQLPVASQQQQVVALVSPRVEQQSSTTQTSQPAEQSVVVASSQAANSSNTVTTTQAGLKRPREDDAKPATQGKRTRMAGSATQEMFPTVTSESGLEVEYQVPTSSQRDQEDEIIVVDSEDEDEEGIPDDGAIEEPDDGPEFEEEADNGDSYAVETYDRDEQDLPGYDEGEGPDIDENGPDQDNNEVEIIGKMEDDSNEVPNQSGSSVGAVDSNAGQASNSSAAVPVASSELHPPLQQHPEATSSGTGSQSVGTVGTSQMVHSFGRGRSIPPLGRQQQQLLLGYEDPGDDSIVPSTPTLFVPRRSDGFGEAVSSPQVPQGRFTFSDTNPPTARSGVAQVASEGMDDTRMDLTQLEESGTGRSVPTTPLQVSPQGDVMTAEMSGEVGQSVVADADQPQGHEAQVEGSSSLPSKIPAITVTEVAEEGAGEEMPPPELADLDEQCDPRDSTGEQNIEQDEMGLADEGGDGVSSEGEKSQRIEEDEEGREAEASEPSMVSSNTRRAQRGGTARRSGRNSFRTRGRPMRPTPIIWNEPGSSMGLHSPRGRAHLIRGGPGEAMRSNFQRGGQRARRMRGKAKGNFPGSYQMRF